MTALGGWFGRQAALKVLLIPGNHDRHAGQPPEEWGIECVQGQSMLAPFSLSHEPVEVADAFVLSGHWHPSFRLNDGIGSGVRMPCFYFTEKMAVLPAFGIFTGTHPVVPKRRDRIFLVGPDAVFEVGAKALAKY